MNNKNTIKNSLEAFFQRLTQLSEQTNIPLHAEYDSDWPSQCIVSVESEDERLWRPVKQHSNNSLSKVETGLEMEIHPHLHHFYCDYWSDHVEAKTERGGLQLLFLWNEQDFVRLQENLIAHVLMKRRLRQRDTLFFAVTDEEDWILSILNDTGEVVLERVGMEPKEILAPNLASFLDSLTPVLSQR